MGETQLNNAGERLKSLREEAGLSLEVLSRVTRINIDYLRALEANKFELLPDQFFVKSFIRYICKELGHAPDKSAQIIQMIYPPAAPPPEASAANREGLRSRAFKRASQAFAAVEAKKPENAAENGLERMRKVPEKSAALSDRPRKAARPKLSQAFGRSAAGASAAGRSKAGSASGSSNSKRKLLPVALVAGLLLLIGLNWGLWKNRSNTDERGGETQLSSTESPKQDPSTSPSPDESTSTPALDANSPLSPVEDQANAATTGLEPQAGLVQAGRVQQAAGAQGQALSATVAESSMIRFQIKEAVKIKHRCDDEEFKVSTFTAEEAKFAFKQKCDFLIYDASAVDAFFNDLPLGQLGAKNRIRRIAFVHGADKSQF